MPAENVYTLVRSDGNNSPTKICSVKIYRCNLIDDISGNKPNNNSATITVPYDIDDLDAQQEALDDDKEVFDGDSALKKIRSEAKKNPLNWMGFTNTSKYMSDLRKFSRALKDAYTKMCKDAFGGKSMSPEELRSNVKIADITSICSIKSLSRDIQFNNTVVLEVSVQEIQGDPVNLFMPKENDVVEIVMGYPDGKNNREFIGLVGGVSFTEENGSLRAINLTCFGISKILLTNRMVTERAVISQFEDGELTQTGLTPWSTNAFANNTADEIFTRIMISQLGLKPAVSGSTTELPLSTQYSVELSAIQERLSQIVAELVSLRKDVEEKDAKGVKKRDSGEADKLVWKQLGTKKEPKTPMSDFAKRSSAMALGGISFDDVLDLADIYVKIRQTVNLNEAKGFDGKTLELSNIVNHLLVKSLYESRQIVLSKLMRDEMKAQLAKLKQEGKTANPKFVIPFVFDTSAFTNTTAFQTIYIPLITMAFIRMGAFNEARELNNEDFGDTDRTQSADDVIAKFTGRRAFAFETMFRAAYELNFSQIETSNQVLEGIRNNAKIYVYENEKNQIVAEIPRYNEFVADAGEDIKDFIIENPSSLEVIRQDMSMVTRIDTKMYYPMTGVFNFVFLSRHFTDPAILAKYGMRADAPVFNPNARNELTTTIYSSLELATRNALTRRMEVTVVADRPYKLGRLYFVHRQSLDTKVGGKGGIPDKTDVTTDTQDTDGYVGFLTSYSTEISYGSPIAHRLSFDFVRKAQLFRKSLDSGETYIANFKILPDISGLIDMMEEASKNAKDDPHASDKKSKVSVAELEAAKHVKTNEGEVFVTDYNVSGTNPWITLEYSHHINLPPLAADKKMLACFNMDSVEAGVKNGLMQTTGLIDLRLRPLNSAILYDRLNVDKHWPGTGQIYYYISNSIFSYSLDLRKAMFDPIFIPTDQKSPRFALSSLRSMNMQIFDLDNTQETSPTYADGNYTAIMPRMGNMTKDVPTSQGATVARPKYRFVIASDTPVRVATIDPDTEKLVIFAVISSGEWFRRQGMDVDGKVTDQLLASNYYKIPEKFNFDTDNAGILPVYQGTTPSNWKPYIKLFNLQTLSKFRQTLKDMVPANLQSKVDAAIDSVSPTYSGEVLFPAIIRGPFNHGGAGDDIINCMQPGIPLSMYDLGQLSQPPFETVFPVDGDASVIAISHAEGRAIDVMFPPFYLESGWVMKGGVAADLMGQTYSGRFNSLLPKGVLNNYIKAGTYGGETMQKQTIKDLYKKNLSINAPWRVTNAKTEEAKQKILGMISSKGAPMKLEDIPEENTIFHCESEVKTSPAPRVDNSGTMVEGETPQGISVTRAPGG